MNRSRRWADDARGLNSGVTTMKQENEEFARAVEYLEGLIRRDVAGGFARLEWIVDNAIEAAGDGLPDPEALRPVAERVFRDALAAQRRTQADWPDVTDCDRLDRAFADLEDRGVVARQHFT